MKNFLNVFHHFLLALVIIISSIKNTYAQENKDYTIQWNSPTLLQNEGTSFYLPSFEGMSIFNGHINYTSVEEVLPKNNFSSTLLGYQTAPADAKEIQFINDNNYTVTPEVKFDSQTSYGAGKRLFATSISAFVLKNGQIHRVIAFQTIVQSKPIQTNYGSKSFATNSVLRPGSGSWYKIAVAQDGIYKIDKAFLTSLGINVASLNPRHINIYGNGDGLLSHMNNAPRTDDLALNSIYIEGESDGQFNDGDYILFYAKGPHRWDLASNGINFENVRHLYSDYSYYFININSSNTPERIPSINSETGANQTCTSYDYYNIHEVDQTNLTKSGQRWYGEKLDVELSRTFNFPIPNPVNNGVSRLKSYIASNSLNSSSGTVRYTVNGNVLAETSVPSNGSGKYGRARLERQFLNNSSSISVTITYNRSNPSTHVYIDKVEVNSRRHLVQTGGQFAFRDLQTVGTGNITEFQVQNLPSNGFIWDVSDRHHPVRIMGNYSGSTFEFSIATPQLKEFVASDNQTFFTPIANGAVQPQNLHNLPQVDYLIVTPLEFWSQAERLANLHRTFNGHTVHVVAKEHIYNEFSSGAQDASAIRLFAKMFYDRSTNSTDKLKYLCLFGDGSYDPKNRIPNNNNYIPTYQLGENESTENPQVNILTDDFYGMLDDNDGMNNISFVDIGVGRLLISSNQIAQEQINKIEHYMKSGSGYFTDNNINCLDGVSSSTFGEWRSKITSIADMEDYFVERDHEPGYQFVKANIPEITVNKLYMDAYNVIATTSGLRAPELRQDIVNSFNSGSLITNYVGHGGVVQLSEAVLVDIPMIEGLRNIDRMPLFVSATCDFTPFDNPEILSAGERMSLNPVGGAIAMMTTTRTVYYSTNSPVIAAFYKNSLIRNTDFSPRTFGEIIMYTKGDVAVTVNSDKAAFNLIGDPALRIALPKYHIVIDSINGKSPALVQDTIKALSKVSVKAHVEDFNGNILTNFNGVATPLLYDKVKTMYTLGHNPGSNMTDANVIPFESQKNIIYKGQSTIANGYFSFEFVVPKDIDYSYGNGKFTLYGNSTTTDAIGSDTRLIIGGVNPNGINDITPPKIKMYLNNENFVNGGITDETPFLIAHITDENGINTVGNGIGHDITAIIDEKSSQPLILNEYFKNELDTYQKGQLRYQMTKLTPGRHTLSLKVWDVNNNSSQETIEFIVQEKAELKLDHVLNYPNPFTTNTQFFFEHNQCCTDLETQIQIFTISGRLVKTINKTIYTQGYRSEGIAWDGKDDFGDDLARGVYVYRLKVKTPNGEMAEKLEKLVLL